MLHSLVITPSLMLYSIPPYLVTNYLTIPAPRLGAKTSSPCGHQHNRTKVYGHTLHSCLQTYFEIMGNELLLIIAFTLFSLVVTMAWVGGYLDKYQQYVSHVPSFEKLSWESIKYQETLHTPPTADTNCQILKSSQLQDIFLDKTGENRASYGLKSMSTPVLSIASARSVCTFAERTFGTAALTGQKTGDQDLDAVQDGVGSGVGGLVGKGGIGESVGSTLSKGL